jgi:hypothetical protein
MAETKFLAPPIQEPISLNGRLNHVWANYFLTLSQNDRVIIGDILLNTIHRTSDGSDHGFIDQDVTTTASPSFAGLTVDNREVLRYIHLVAR